MESTPTKIPKQPELSEKTLKTAAYLAFFPLTGIFGIHNLILKQYKECILRIIIAALMTISVLDWTYRFIHIPPGHPQIFTIILVASPFIAVALYAWAFAEGILILKKTHYKEVLPTTNKKEESPTATPAAADKQDYQTSNANHDTSYYTSNLTDAIEQEQKQNLQKDDGKSTIVAFVFSVVLILYWGSIFLTNASSVGCTGGDFGLGLSMMMCIPIDVIMAAFAIAFGIKGLKTKLHGLAIASLVITIIANILIPFAFMWVMNLCH